MMKAQGHMVAKGAMCLVLALCHATSSHAQRPIEGPTPRGDIHGDPLPKGAIARLGTDRLRHIGQMMDLTVSPDGRFVVSVGHQQAVHVWDVATGREVKRLHGPTVQSGTALFSPDGSLLIVGGRPGSFGGPSIFVWEADTWTPVREITADSEIEGAAIRNRFSAYEMAISPDGKLLATGDSGNTEPGLRLWSVEIGAELMSHSGYSGPYNHLGSLVFSPDGRTLAAGGAGDILIRRLDAEDEPIHIPGHPGRNNSLVISPDGSVLYVAGYDAVNPHEERSPLPPQFGGGVRTVYDAEPSLRAWTLRENPPKAMWEVKPETGGFGNLILLPDGKRLITTLNRDIRIFDAATGEAAPMPESMDASATRPNKLSISADGRILASGQSRSAIHLWDLETMRSIDPPLERHEEFVEAIAFMPDGKSLVAMEEYGRTVVWDLETSRQRRVMDFGDGYQPTRIDLSPDGRLLATGAERGEIKLWNVESGEEVGSIPAILGRDDGAIRFSPSGRMLASVSRSAWENRPEDESAERRVAVELWDVESRELVGRLYQPASESLYNGLAFSPDGRSLLAVDQDKPVRIWDIETGALKQKLEMHVMRGYAGLAVSPDFKILASGGPTRATPGFVGSSAMSTAFDHRIHLWSLETGELLREIGLHGNEPSLLHFTPDGRRLLSGMTWSGDEPWVNVFDLERNRVVLRLEHDPDLLISRYPNEGGDLGASPLAVSPDGKTAATGMINGTILIWDLAREDPPDARR